MTPDALLTLQRLLTLCSPAFPIGAYSYSGGLEAAVDQDLLSNRAQLLDWVRSQLFFGSIRQDCWLVAQAGQAGQGVTAELADLALAVRPTAELRLEARQQGNSFIRAAGKGWPEVTSAAPDVDWSLAIAFGFVAGRLSIAPELALSGFAHAAAANLISAAVRAVPLGQSDAVIAQAELEGDIARLVDQALGLTELPPTTVAHADLLSAQHEVQYSRMFRS